MGSSRSALTVKVRRPGSAFLVVDTEDDLR